VFAAGRNLRAAPDGVPCCIRPLDGAAVAHVACAYQTLNKCTALSG
jgi:hypothetical protein